MTSLPPASVPDPDALRRAMLAASWKRDHRVARRRIMLRWTLWALQRYGWMAGLMLALVAAVWWWTQFPHTAALQAPASPATDTTIAPTTPAETAVLPPVHVPDAGGEASGIHASPASATPGIALRFSDWASATRPAPSAHLPAAETAGNPSLKSEDWLHSKEP